MKTAFAIITLAGLASVSLSQQTSLNMQVSKDGVNWSNFVSVDRRTGDTGRVLVRAVVSWLAQGSTLTPVGFAYLTFQPVIVNPRFGIDVIAPFANAGNNLNGGGIDLDATPLDGPFGRLRPFAATGVAATAPATVGNSYAVLQHSAGFGGAPTGNFYRIARNDISRWMGTGTTSGSAAVNNFNGAGGLACTQKGSGDVTTEDPAFLGGITNIELFRFALDAGDGSNEMRVTAPTAGMNRDTITGVRQASWFSASSDHGGSLKSPVIVTDSVISVVPTPGTLGLLASAGLLAIRRKRRDV